MILAWSKNCVSADMTVRAAGNNNIPPAIVAPVVLTFLKQTQNYIFQLLLCQKKKRHETFRTIKIRV